MEPIDFFLSHAGLSPEDEEELREEYALKGTYGLFNALCGRVARGVKRDHLVYLLVCVMQAPTRITAFLSDFLQESDSPATLWELITRFWYENSAEYPDVLAQDEFGKFVLCPRHGWVCCHCRHEATLVVAYVGELSCGCAAVVVHDNRELERTFHDGIWEVENLL